MQDGDGLHGCGRACVGEKGSACREVAIGTATLPGKSAGQGRPVIDQDTRLCKIPLSFRLAKQRRSAIRKIGIVRRQKCDTKLQSRRQRRNVPADAERHERGAVQKSSAPVGVPPERRHGLALSPSRRHVRPLAHDDRTRGDAHPVHPVHLRTRERRGDLGGLHPGLHRRQYAGPRPICRPGRRQCRRRYGGDRLADDAPVLSH